METIGKYLKEVRVKKKRSREKVAKETKIREEFVAAIEKEEWESLPEFPVVVGFVKSISRFLGADERRAVALLRRDYPPKVLPINPKPDISSKFVWSPKITFILGVATVLVLILGYLGFQYAKFMSPPKLIINRPEQEEVVSSTTLEVLGKTDPDATVKVNNQPVLVEADGTFKAEIEVLEDTKEVVVKAVSRSGKETVVRRKIEVRLDE